MWNRDSHLRQKLTQKALNSVITDIIFQESQEQSFTGNNDEKAQS